jgi:hypothetical protein
VRRWLVAALLLLLPAASVHAFVCIKTNPNGPCLHWTQGNATLRSALGSSGGVLLNGTQSWDQNALNAANDWNAVGTAFQFSVQFVSQFTDPCVGSPQPGDNPVLFARSVCGRGFGDIVAETVNHFDTNTGAMINAPVFVTSNTTWNAYDDPLRPGLNDIRRVLLHEFGHVLGLDHPDQNGQTVDAIMNSQESDINRLQTDDRTGIQFLYPHNAAPTSGCQLADGSTAASPWPLLPAAVVFTFRWLPRRRNRKG